MAHIVTSSVKIQLRDDHVERPRLLRGLYDGLRVVEREADELLCPREQV